jgi:hypothetical protein
MSIINTVAGRVGLEQDEMLDLAKRILARAKDHETIDGDDYVVLEATFRTHLRRNPHTMAINGSSYFFFIHQFDTRRESLEFAIASASKRPYIGCLRSNSDNEGVIYFFGPIGECAKEIADVIRDAHERKIAALKEIFE